MFSVSIKCEVRSPFPFGSLFPVPAQHSFLPPLGYEPHRHSSWDSNAHWVGFDLDSAMLNFSPEAKGHPHSPSHATYLNFCLPLFSFSKHPIRCSHPIANEINFLQFDRFPYSLLWILPSHWSARRAPLRLMFILSGILPWGFLSLSPETPQICGFPLATKLCSVQSG